MKKIKMLLVAIFALFAYNTIAMAQCSEQNNSSNYSIDADTGTKYCSTLSEAFSEVKDNGTITVLSSSTESSRVNAPGRNVILDLNGNTITLSATTYGIVLANVNDNLTIKDSGSSGKIVHSNGGLALIAAAGDLTIDGGTIEANTANSTIQFGSNGTFTMNGGTIENKNNASKAISLFLFNSANAIINNGTIKSTAGLTIQVGCEDSNANLTINNGIINNTNTSEGLAIAAYNGTIDIYGGTVTSATKDSTIQVGHPDWSVDGILNVKGGKVENTGENGGRAIFVARGTSTINSGNIVSQGNGATIQVGNSKDYNAHLIVNDGNIEHKKNIPAIIVPYGDSDAIINGGNIKINEDDNTSTNDTAIMIGMNPSDGEVDKDYGSGAKVSITNGNITGGISLFGKQPELNISGGNITARSFAVSGNGSPEGSVNATIGSKINISGGNLTSTSNAAIYHPQNGTLTISDGTISGKIGIVARQGNINITGGKIAATGSDEEKIRVGDAKENGAFVQLPTGTAIIVDNSEEDAYKDEAKVTVSGEDAIIDGTNQSILSYNGNKKQDFEITGGTFLSKGIKDDVKEFINNTEYGQSQSGLVGKVHNITFNYDHDKGSVESYTDATEKEEVTFTVKPNVDYAVDSIEIKTSDNENVDYTSSSNKHTFKMPDKDVTVSIKFKVVYADYSDLYEALLKAKGIDTSKYTKESIKALLEAIEDAEKIEKGLRASQQYRINNLIYALNNAIANLVAINSNTVKPSEPVPDTYDNGSIYFGFAIITLGTMLISIKKLKNN